MKLTSSSRWTWRLYFYVSVHLRITNIPFFNGNSNTKNKWSLRCISYCKISKVRLVKQDIMRLLTTALERESITVKWLYFINANKTARSLVQGRSSRKQYKPSCLVTLLRRRVKEIHCYTLSAMIKKSRIDKHTWLENIFEARAMYILAVSQAPFINIQYGCVFKYRMCQVCVSSFRQCVQELHDPPTRPRYSPRNTSSSRLRGNGTPGDGRWGNAGTPERPALFLSSTLSPSLCWCVLSVLSCSDLPLLLQLLHFIFLLLSGSCLPRFPHRLLCVIWRPANCPCLWFCSRVIKFLLCVPLPLKTVGLPLLLTLTKRDFTSESRRRSSDCFSSTKNTNSSASLPKGTTGVEKLKRQRERGDRQGGENAARRCYCTSPHFLLLILLLSSSSSSPARLLSSCFNPSCFAFFRSFPVAVNYPSLSLSLTCTKPVFS